MCLHLPFFNDYKSKEIRSKTKKRSLTETNLPFTEHIKQSFLFITLFNGLFIVNFLKKKLYL